MFARNVLLGVEIQKDFKGVQPSRQYVPGRLFGGLWMLILDHIERLDTLAEDGYGARTRQGRMLLEEACVCIVMIREGKFGGKGLPHWH